MNGLQKEKNETFKQIYELWLETYQTTVKESTFLKTEIKFSLATERNYDGKFTFNHIGLKKDWEQIIFVGVNGDGEMKVAKFWKNDLPLYLFTRQSGGNHLSNDDWMITKEQSTILFSLGS